MTWETYIQVASTIVLAIGGAVVMNWQTHRGRNMSDLARDKTILELRGLCESMLLHSKDKDDASMGVTQSVMSLNSQLIERVGRNGTPDGAGVVVADGMVNPVDAEGVQTIRDNLNDALAARADARRAKSGEADPEEQTDPADLGSG